jgi:hypothetical protein
MTQHPKLSNNDSISNGKPQHATEPVLPAEEEIDNNFLDNYKLDAKGNDEQSLSCTR